MKTSQQLRRVVRFGTFELDLAAGALRKNGRRVRLQEQPFQFLAALIEKPGEVVTREELKDKLWSGDTYVDFDRSLNTAASKLREALGDSASSPRFVETLPRRGYRFLASVELVGGLPINGATANQGQPSEKGRSTAPRVSRAGWYVAASVLAAVAVAGSWWALRDPVTEVPLNPVPLTSYEGIERHPTFSPDGNEVAFAWDGGGDNSDIYRKLIGPGEPLALTTHPSDEYAPAWSPDGRHIAFFRDLENERVGLFLIPALGGPERPLMEKRAGKYGVDRLAWSPDSKWLVFSDEIMGDFRYGLHLLSVATGKTRQITFPPKSSRAGDHNASFSPDGRSLLFIRTEGFEGAVYVLALSEGYTPQGEPERLTTHYKRTHSAFWTRDGREVIFAAGDGLWRVPVFSPKLATPLASIAGRANDLVLASKGGRFAYSRSDLDRDLWLLAVSGLDGSKAPSERFAPSTRPDYEPRWSPDNTRVAFTSRRSGNKEIWVCDRDGSNARRVTNFDGRHVGWPNWSPDSKLLAFDGQGAARDIYVVNADGGEPRRVTTNPSDDAVPSWSRDGEWIYFASQRTGESEIWKIPADGGDAVPLTTTGGRWPYESPDGHVYYARSTKGERAIWRVPSDGGTTEHVLGGLDAPIGAKFAVVDRAIYFIRRSTINRMDSETGETKRIAEVQPGFGGLNVSPDEKWILGSQREETGSDIMLVDNFQ